MQPLIIADNLGKRFRRYGTWRPRSVIEAAFLGWKADHTDDRFWVLRGVDFRVFPGEMLGIVGRNGVGKSTLLSLVAGLLRADEGTISVRGKVGALLDLGRSLHPQLTGRENIRTMSFLSGLTGRQLQRRLDQIVEFTDIEGFLDAPVRTYSSGMKARLAFSVAVHTEPDILLVDEFLFVGDQFFQEKCIERIRALMRAGTAVLLTSHIAAKISDYCDRALWLGDSGIQAAGAPAEVLAQYQAHRQLAEVEKARSGAQT
jgi:lipopolysaccharide transport system ATP-binding protein